ncbi:MAG: hypothetical protein JNN07_06995 [Verrucomicrobiales bacterium]|nr:hypothetical protein [Verrucomicrobiales bacterium]
MHPRVITVMLLMVPLVASANPVMVDGQSLLAFSVVALCALVIESGMVTLTLASCGLFIVPAFITSIFLNVGFFLLGFVPLSDRVSLWILEPGVVLADAILIKLMSAIPILQDAGFEGVGWRRALLASLLGNTSSFFVGVILCGAPWVVH